MSPTRRVVILALGVAALAGTAWLLPLRSWQASIASLGPVAPVLGVALGAALLVALVPRTPVSLACGVLFGAALGTVCALALALLAAGITFAAGRWLGRDFVARRAGRWWRTLENWVAGTGTSGGSPGLAGSSVLAVAAVRSIPIGPYGLTGYAYGASAVRTCDYAIGTAIAATPSAISYALLGAAVADGGTANLLTLAPLGAGLVLSLALILLRLHHHRLRLRPPSRRSCP